MITVNPSLSAARTFSSGVSNPFGEMSPKRVRLKSKGSRGKKEKTYINIV